MNKENMDFGRPHHSGMPTAKELKWREDVIRAEFEAKYGEPVGVTKQTAGTTITEPGVPSNGTIKNFRIPTLTRYDVGMSAVYDRKVAKAETAWNTRMD